MAPYDVASATAHRVRGAEAAPGYARGPPTALPNAALGAIQNSGKLLPRVGNPRCYNHGRDDIGFPAGLAIQRRAEAFEDL